MAESKAFIKEETEKNVKVLEAEKHYLNELSAKPSEEDPVVEGLKVIVREGFEMARSVLNKKEDDILTAIGNEGKTVNFGESIGKAQDIIGFMEKDIPDPQNFLSELDKNGVTIDSANKAISIAREAKEAKEVKEASKWITDLKLTSDTSDFEADINKVVDALSLIRGPSVREERKFVLKQVSPFSVSFEWDKSYKVDEYGIILQKEGKRYGLICQTMCTGNTFTINTLEPETTYKAFVQAKRGNLYSYWSSPFIFKTAPQTIEAVVEIIKVSHAIEQVCVAALHGIKKLSANGFKT